MMYLFPAAKLAPSARLVQECNERPDTVPERALPQHIRGPATADSRVECVSIYLWEFPCGQVLRNSHLNSVTDFISFYIIHIFAFFNFINLYIVCQNMLGKSSY
jgi:hypothetical protein